MANTRDLPHRMSALDAIFLNFERPSQLMHIACILTFDGVLSYEQLIADLGARLHLVSRYTQRVMPVPLSLAHPTWEADPEFDLRSHVQRRVLPSPGSDEQLAEICSALYGQQLSRRKPLWEMYLIDGYRGSLLKASPCINGQSGAPAIGRGPAASGSARSVLFVKVHHSMVDGISGVQLLEILLDAHPRPRPVKPPRPSGRQPLPGFASRFAAGLSDTVSTGAKRGMATLALLARPQRAMRELGETADTIAGLLRTVLAGAPRTPLDGASGGPRGLAWTTFPLNQVKAIKNRLGGSVNDVVLAVVSGALRQVLDRRGMNPDRLELRALMPVNVRGAHELLQLGNQISVLVAPLPVGILDPVERLRQVRAATALLKNRNEPARMGRLIKLADLIPPSIQQLCGRRLRVRVPIDTICTNVPGPPVALYMQAVRLERMMPFVPLIEGMGVAFAILSYADTLTLGMTADSELMPDLQEVVVPLNASFEELSAASGLTPVREWGIAAPERDGRAYAVETALTDEIRTPDVVPPLGRDHLSSALLQGT